MKEMSAPIQSQRQLRRARAAGWLLGGARLNGRAAMVDAAVGTGHVYLYGFRPQYRAQTNATWPLMWSAILR